jgi:hypothetical protein
MSQKRFLALRYTKCPLARNERRRIERVRSRPTSGLRVLRTQGGAAQVSMSMQQFQLALLRVRESHVCGDE